ncbi:hypothetical protein DIJ64_02915 [Mycobacterium leprae]|uniref:Uncharacterized protein n=1 Tax=Mycobacterium leprae TaxID=1769 RepID=A0AAD0P7C2_MYCLR|nr:hypothetical protein DIJ64_02915 [Mycobacterium leprae]
MCQAANVQCVAVVSKVNILKLDVAEVNLASAAGAVVATGSGLALQFGASVYQAGARQLCTCKLLRKVVCSVP